MASISDAKKIFYVNSFKGAWYQFVKRFFLNLLYLMVTPYKPFHYLELFTRLKIYNTYIIKARVISSRLETLDSRTITLKPGHRWKMHRSGQHVNLSVLINGRYHTRTYSISSSPDRKDGYITITVKAIGLVSNYLVYHLQPGAFLLIGLPQGNFVLPKIPPKKILFITAGSGITPIMSMLRTHLLGETILDILHIHYTSHAGNTIFGAELRSLAIQYPNYKLREIYTRAQESTAASIDYLSQKQLSELCPDSHLRDVWACGPPSMLNAAKFYFEQIRRASHLHTEQFFILPTSSNRTVNKVHFLKGGQQIDACSSRPLLEIAEEANLSPPSGCRIGICHSCSITLLAGCVRDLRNGKLTDEPNTKIQLCINAAVSTIKLDL